MNPTIWDILGYEESSGGGDFWEEVEDPGGGSYWINQGTGETSMTLPAGANTRTPTGRAGQLDYLYDLLDKSGVFEEGGAYVDPFGYASFSTPGSANTEYTNIQVDPNDILDLLSSDESWVDMDLQELVDFLTKTNVAENGGSTLIQDVAGEKIDIDASGFYGSTWRGIEALQEAFKALPTSESFGLDRKIGDIKTAGKRELKSAREGYIPGEILSRYGALQGKPGAEQKGEQIEQAYIEDVYGVQRGMGRDITGVYGDFEDAWFGGVQSWLGGLG